MSQIGSLFLRVGVKNDASKQMSGILKGMRGQMMKFGLAFGAFNFFKTGISQASDFAEAQDSLNRLIGKDGVAALTKFGKTASATAGISSADALTMANNFAGLFAQIPKGAINTGKALVGLEQRVADLGSQFNKSNEEIFKGLQSALSGRVSLTLQQMGIDLSATSLQAEIAAGHFTNMGIAAGTSMASIDKGTLVLMRYRSFLEQTKKSTGNFAATLGISLPNQMKKFKSSMADAKKGIGQALMPAIMKIMPMLQKMADFIANNTKLILGLAAAFVGFKLGGFITKIGIAIAQLVAMAVAKTAAQTGIGALAAVPMVLGAIGAGIAVAVGMSGMGSSAGSSGAASSGTSPSTAITVNVNSATGETSVAGNAQNVNVQSNFGRGGS